jgi:hypothetical protein
MADEQQQHPRPLRQEPAAKRPKLEADTDAPALAAAASIATVAAAAAGTTVTASDRAEGLKAPPDQIDRDFRRFYSVCAGPR